MLVQSCFGIWRRSLWDNKVEEVSSERLHAFGDTCFSGINARDQTQQLGSTVASTYQE